MEKLKQFASEHAIQFAVLAVLYYLNFSIVAGVLGSLVEQHSMELIIRTLVVLVGTGLLLVMMKRFGWLEAAGFVRLGGWRLWLLTAALLAYDLLGHIFGFFGDLTIRISDPGVMVTLGTLYLVDGAFQEFIFRGVVLYTFIRIWGNSQAGIYKSVLLSAFVFASLHIFNLVLGEEPWLVGLQLVSTIMAGIYYAVLVLFGGSLWPAVVIHGVLNASINIYAVNTPGFSESVGGWILILLLQLQLVMLSLMLLRRMPPRPVIPEVP